jgi:hypothetical protein
MPTSAILSLSGSVNKGDTTAANFAAVSTLEDLNAITPKTFLPRLAPLYRKVCDTAVKASHAQATLATFNSHSANGTFPPSIQGALKVPTVQVTKEFDNTSHVQALDGELQIVIRNARVQSLENAIKRKTQEHTFLLDLLSSDRLKNEVKHCVRETHELVGPSFASGVTADGKPVFAAFYNNDYSFVSTHGIDLMRKAVAIGFARHQRELVSKMTKLKLKRDTDVAMQDSTVNDVAKQIELAVSAALRARDKKNKPPSSSKKGTCHQRDHMSSADTASSNSDEEGHSQQTSKTHFAQQNSRKRQREWEEETQEKVKDLILRRPKRFNARDAFSYPIEFFQQTERTRVAFSLLNSSLDFVNSLPAFQCDVFMGPGVVLDRDSRQKLSLNGKFVLHAQRDNRLLPTAMKTLRRTIRIKWFFRDKPDRPYREKFRTKSDWEPPKATLRIELAIDRVERALLSQASLLPSRSYQLNPEISPLCKYLRESKYLVKITDKNLGLSVVTKDWYLEQCHKHLNDEDSYLQLEHCPYEDLDKQFRELLQHQWDKEIRGFLLQTTSSLPRFHVIPKVHKNPWATRPIVPSHSWITSRASEVLDYFLQKHTRTLETVLDSTRSFISKIRRIKTDEDCILVTGDVKAMYTSIPLKGAKFVTEQALQSVDREMCSYGGLRAIMNFVLDNNYFLFQGRLYQQKNGIAMGTACAPAVANLYAGFYENISMPALKESGLLFYGRYIDDIFLIFRGPEHKLNDMLSQLEIPGLEILWEHSKSRVSFLDVDVRLVQGDLVTTVFRKDLNRYMYIPFSSGHPLSVKKALVKAERSRMKNICSSEELFHECQEAFRLNLYRRGYPSQLLQKWFSDDLKPRLETKEKAFFPTIRVQPCMGIHQHEQT